MIFSLPLLAMMQQPPSIGGIVHCRSYKSSDGVNDCTVCDNGPTTCSLVAPLGGYFAIPDSPKPQPEPMDVPAIQEGEDKCTEIVNNWCAQISRSYSTCADKRRVLLTSENGEKHCILFQREP